MRNSNRKKVIQCFADYETNYKPFITTDPESTPFAFSIRLISSLWIGGFVSIQSVQKEGLVSEDIEWWFRIRGFLRLLLLTQQDGNMHILPKRHHHQILHYVIIHFVDLTTFLCMVFLIGEKWDGLWCVVNIRLFRKFKHFCQRSTTDRWVLLSQNKELEIWWKN